MGAVDRATKVPGQVAFTYVVSLLARDVWLTAMLALGKRAVENVIGAIMAKEKTVSQDKRKLTLLRKKLAPDYHPRTPPTARNIEDWIIEADIIEARIESTEYSIKKLTSRMLAANEDGPPHITGAILRSEFGRHIVAMSLVRSKIMEKADCHRRENDGLIRMWRLQPKSQSLPSFLTAA